MSSESLINRYRPQKFEEVIGQADVVRSFRTAIKERVAHSFVFVGPRGVGKTTLARLGADALGAKGRDITEVNAGKFTGVDDMRNLTEGLSFRPLGGKLKVLIIDEAHMASRNAWQSILKPIEEPPAWVKWFFCTTEVNKVPETVKSRSNLYNLRPVPVNDLYDFLLEIVELEGFNTSSQVVQLCARMADGSPRQALSNLAVCYAVKDRKEAAGLIANLELEEGGTPFKLAQALAQGWKWDKVRPILVSLREEAVSPETVRHTVREYFTKAIEGNEDQASVCRILPVLENFAEPFQQGDGYTPLVLAVTRSLFAV